MEPRRLLPLAAIPALLAFSACSGAGEGTALDTQAMAESEAVSAIETFVAEPASAVPLGTVPGTVTLPPEARVAVTSPFPGAAIRVLVIEGQRVSRGQPLALVRAAEPLRIGGDFVRAESEVRVAEARAARLATLADEGIVASARADEARAQLEQARATHAENRRLASLAGTGRDGSMTLRAPIGGRVGHVGIETGGPVDPMSAPFVIEAVDAFRLDLALPERLAGKVRPGMAVEVRLPVESGEALTVGGRIISVAPSIDPRSRSVMAKATIDAAPGLVPGQNVTATIIAAPEAEGVSVPSRALTRIAGSPQVFVRSNGVFEPRPVMVIAEGADRTVIAEGLSAGEEVAVSGVAELKAAAAE